MSRLFEISHIGAERVDRDRGIIPNVKILGRESKNGRTYSDKALREAAAKYEGVDVNVNHPDRKSPNAERRVEDGFGWLESVTVKADGVYGNLHYLKEHPAAGLVAEAAERRSNRFGLSHNAQGTVARKGDKNVVESIEKVLSVDLVQNPATNNGLFESELRTIRETLEQHAPKVLELLEDGALLPPEAMDDTMAPAAPQEDGKASAKAALVQLLAALVELPGDIKQICVQLIDVAQKIIAGQPEPKDPNADPNAVDAEGNPIEPKDPNADPNAEQPGDKNSEPAADGSADPEAGGSANDNPFAKRKKNMAESTKGKSVEERLALLEAENRELKEKISHSDLREQCEALLSKHRRASTPARITALANMPSEESRLQLIEEWDAIEEAPPARPRRPDFTSPPAHSGKLGAYPSDVKSFVAACH